MATAFMEKSKAAIARQAQAAKARLANIQEKATEIAGEAIRTVETVGAGSGMAYVRARYGDENNEIRVANIPVELLLAGLGKGAAFLGTFKEYDSHVHAVSNGLLTEYGVLLAFELGLEARDEAA